MMTYEVEVSTANKGEAPVRTKCEVIGRNGCDAIQIAIAMVRPADNVSVFCKSTPMKKEKAS